MIFVRAAAEVRTTAGAESRNLTRDVRQHQTRPNQFDQRIQFIH
jgi:hypothetical protein